MNIKLMGTNIKILALSVFVFTACQYWWSSINVVATEQLIGVVEKADDKEGKPQLLSEQHVGTTSRTTLDESKQGPAMDHHDNEEVAVTASFPNLRAIVTGLARSGTTITGKLLMNAPCIIGATETGYLRAKTPANISTVQPWYNWDTRQDLVMHHMLKPEDFAAMEKAKDFSEMYGILRSRSHLYNDLIDEPYCAKPYQMIDKTPKYIHPEYFENILDKTPNVPVIITQKAFEAQHDSWKRRGGGDKMTKAFYNETFNGVERMKEKYPGRILVVKTEELMNDPDSVMTTIFNFLDLQWDHEYLKMSGLKKKFVNYPTAMEKLNSWEFTAGKHSDH